MERELWIGLADVAPTDANSEEEFDDCAGAFVHALALADDPDDFLERVRTALAGLEFELLDLEDPEPVAVRLRREGLSDLLVEVAIEAARGGEVELGTFHLYPWEDEEDDPASLYAALAAALEAGQLVRLGSAADPELDHDGYVVGIGEGWLLLHNVDPSVFLNGWTALPLDEIERVAVLAAEETVVVAALALRGEGPVARPELALDDLPGLLASLERAAALVSVFRDRAEPGVFAIGRVERLGDDSFILRHVSRAGRWSDSGGYRYDEVTRIDFGGGYEDALALVAGELATG